MGKNKKAEIEYPFAHGAVIIYTSDGVSIHLVATKIQVPFLIQLPERKETAQGLTIGDFKKLNGCDRRKLMMDQQHCSYSTTLTKMTE